MRTSLTSRNGQQVQEFPSISGSSSPPVSFLLVHLSPFLPDGFLSFLRVLTPRHVLFFSHLHCSPGFFSSSLSHLPSVFSSVSALFLYLLALLPLLPWLCFHIIPLFHVILFHVSFSFLSFAFLSLIPIPSCLSFSFCHFCFLPFFCPLSSTPSIIHPSLISSPSLPPQLFVTCTR